MAPQRAFHMNAASMGVQPMMGAVATIARIPLRTFGTCAMCGDERTLCCTRAHATLCCACECVTNPQTAVYQEASSNHGAPTVDGQRLCLGCERWYPAVSKFWYMRGKFAGARPYGKCKQCCRSAASARWAIGKEKGP